MSTNPNVGAYYQASIEDLSDAGFQPQPWLGTVPQLLKGLFAQAKATAELEPGRELPSESVANRVIHWLTLLANECPDLPEPELLSTPDGSIQLSWSNAGAYFVVTSRSARVAKARFEDMATGKVERATLDWGDSEPALSMVEKLVRGFA
jgi:hypothetical protein